MPDAQLTIIFGLRVPYLRRFWEKVQLCEHGSTCHECCWLWTGTHNKLGYGNFAFEKQTRHAYRVAYRFVRGPIPEGLHLDHLCRNAGCVNPWHLEAVTQRENILRGESPFAKAARSGASSHCKNGHIYDETNIYMIHDRRKGQYYYRVCRICKNMKSREYYARDKLQGKSRKRRTKSFGKNSYSS